MNIRIGRGGEGHAGEVFRRSGESRPLWCRRQNFQPICDARPGARQWGVHILLYLGRSRALSINNSTAAKKKKEEQNECRRYFWYMYGLIQCPKSSKANGSPN